MKAKTNNVTIIACKACAKMVLDLLKLKIGFGDKRKTMEDFIDCGYILSDFACINGDEFISKKKNEKRHG